MATNKTVDDDTALVIGLLFIISIMAFFIGSWCIWGIGAAFLSLAGACVLTLLAFAIFGK